MLRARAATIPQRAHIVHGRGGHARRRRRQPIELGKRADDRVAKSRGKAACDSRGRLDGDLLPENRAQSQLETIEGARHALAGIALDGARETFIPGQLLRDQVGPRVEIE